MDIAFLDLIRTYKKKRCSCEIINNSFNNAVSLSNELLILAGDKQEDVRIVTGSLPDVFYDQLVPGLHYCMVKGSKIEVLVLDANAITIRSSFRRALERYKFDVIQSEMPLPKNLPHFMLVSDRRYRLRSDGSKQGAIGNFNDKKLGRKLLALYETLRQQIIINKPI